MARYSEKGIPGRVKEGKLVSDALEGGTWYWRNSEGGQYKAKVVRGGEQRRDDQTSNGDQIMEGDQIIMPL